MFDLEGHKERMRFAEAYDVSEELRDAIEEIKRLRTVVESAAQYHEVYVEKLKDSDPARSMRQQERANHLRRQIKGEE